MDFMDKKIEVICYHDFPIICRMCLITDEFLKPFEQIHLYTFQNITNIEIEIDDHLPKNVCNACVDRIDNISSFISLCKSNDERLKQILINENLKPCLEDHSSETDIIDGDLDKVKDENIDIKIEQCDLVVEDTKDSKSSMLISEHLENTKVGRHSSKRQPSRCEICAENFTTKTRLLEHQKKNINCRTTPYKCTKCDKAFFAKYKLNLHMRSHTKETPFECRICLKRFRFAPNLKRHDDIAHKGLKPFKCDICGKEFARNTNLIEHKRDHSGECPFICNYCGLSFKKTASYNYHLNLHRASNSENNSEDLICKTCGKIFGSKTTLKAHRISHTKENNFLCDICGKNFRTKQVLKNHVSQVHLGVKQFKCKFKFCEKSFSRKSTLEVHTLYHTKEKPYKCKSCLRTFAQLVHLKNHERIHNGEKPYKCTYCSKSFSVKCNLVIHTRMHTNDATYKCTVCEKMYYESRSLKNHMKLHQDSSLIVLTNEDITTLLS